MKEEIKEEIQNNEKRFENEREELKKRNEEIIKKVVDETVFHIEDILSRYKPYDISKIKDTKNKHVIYKIKKTKNEEIKLLFLILSNYFCEEEKYKKLINTLNVKGYENPKWDIDRDIFSFEFIVS